jgi:penicillin-binding protein 2
MAVAYSTLVEHGRVPRPHLGLQIEDSTGRLIQRIEPGAARRVGVDEASRQAILDGLHLAASAPGGTSADVWTGWNQSRFPVFGKTGTAQRPPRADQSWYVCWIKDVTKGDQDPGIVIAVTVEEGGFGAEAAAPAARLIASTFFRQKGKLVVGKSRTR